ISGLFSWGFMSRRLGTGSAFDILHRQVRRGTLTMAAESTPSTTGSAQKPEPEHSSARSSANLRKYGIPLLVVLLAVAILATITRNWNSWEGGRIEQVTDDAYVRGDITPLSTKVAGLVKEVMVSDYQSVHSGDLIVQLDDDDFTAQVAQASAAVEAAKAAIEDDRRQQELQDTRIERALAGVDQANAQIAAAQAGKEAAQAEVVRTALERKRQEALLPTGSTTQQTVEQAVANERRYSAELESRDADLVQAKTSLRSSELAVEAERRTKSVLESQEAQLTADLHAKDAALVGAKVNLGYTRITAPEDGTVGERQVRRGQLVSPGTQVISFISRI